MTSNEPRDVPSSPTSARGTAAWRIKSAYAGTVQGVGRALTKIKVLPATPPPRDRKFKHWLVSLTRVHDSMAIAELGVPWWTYGAIDAVESWIHGRGSVRVFEYGSGASTFWLAERTDEVITVEHHPEFAAAIGPELSKLPNVVFKQVDAPPSPAPRVGSEKPGSEHLDFYDYVHSIDAVEGEFDLIVIDGRAREECLRVARPRLAKGGIIVFDNTHRGRYRQAIEETGMVAKTYSGLTPTLPYPDRTSVLTEPRGDSTAHE